MILAELAEPLRRDWGVSPRGNTARASPPDWPKRDEGGSLGQWGWGSENAGMKAICVLYYMFEKTKVGLFVRSDGSVSGFTPLRSGRVNYNYVPLVMT